MKNIFNTICVSVFCLTFVLQTLQYNVFLVSDILTVISIFIIPGVLLLRLLKLQPESLWEGLCFVIGLSLSFLMAGGLLMNSVLQQVGVVQPLTQQYIHIGFYSFTVLLFYLYYKSNDKIPLSLQAIRLKRYDLMLLLALLSFPVLAVLGAISINNGGTNLFTVILLGSIGAYVTTLIVLHKKVSHYIFPTALYSIGLSLLFMISLRSWNISGHDIQLEYYVFQLTKQNQLWNIDLYKDAYNASLSITILPTILSSFFHFNDIYIYKIIYQTLFAFCPVVIYMMIKKYTTPLLSFIATFYFISFPTFLSDMTMLNRQEIGFIFFSLLLYMFFRQSTHSRKTIVLLIFGMSMVISHYSTTYITVGILTILYFMQLLLKPAIAKKFLKRTLSKNALFQRANKFHSKQYLSVIVVGTLFIFTFFWYSLLTKTSGNLIHTIQMTITNINTIFKEDNKSPDLAYSLFSSRKVSDTEYLNRYISSSITATKKEHTSDFYDPHTYAQYKPEIMQKNVLPLTKIGNILKHSNISVFDFNYSIRQFFAKFIQILICFGLIGLYFFKTVKKYDKEYVYACFVSVMLIVFMIILPELSLSYGLLRLFQQLLIFLCLPVVIGSLLLLQFANKKYAVFFTGMLSVLFFLTLSGFISEITGGYYPQLNLNNSGLYYDAYYMHDSEVSSIHWLSYSMGQEVTVQADPIARDKLFTYGHIYSLNGTIPHVIQKSAYVYAGFTNNKERTVISVDRNLFIKFPLSFLDQNKDVVYNNGLTRVYK